MAITDYTANPITQMREAWLQALDELVNSSDSNYQTLYRIITLVTELRNSEQMTQLQPSRMVNMLWDSIRGSDLLMYTSVMAMATTFTLELDSLDLAVEHFVNCLIPYTATSKIVDQQTLQRTPSHKELTETLRSNAWLFMLMFGATQFRVTNKFMLGAGIKSGGSKK